MITSKKVFEAQPVVTEMVVKSMIEGIHFYKTEKPKTIAILKKYMKLENAEELEETYSYYVKLIAEKTLSHREEYSDHPRLVEAAGRAQCESGAIHTAQDCGKIG
jgi:hypothetical protein